MDEQETSDRGSPDELTQSGLSLPGNDDCRIVGMGGSAGGLEAFVQFFSHLPPDTGLAFVLVPHLEPTHKGMLPELLGRHTKMQVSEVQDGVEVLPNRVYVIPPNADLAILHGRLQVLDPIAPRGLRTPIDFFFRQLAADQKENAIGVILSGMGSDGTQGMKAIKENSGLAMVQDPASAQYDGMPRSAINTGLADYVAPAEELATKLTQYVHRAPRPAAGRESQEGEPSAALQKVFVLLRARNGNDFSCYKTNTILRRIERRMSIHQFGSLARYVRFLQESTQELDLLYHELLIGVTNFFRDPGLFHFLRKEAIPALLRDKPPDAALRIWNPGCSTGEETYSLAMVLKECLDDLGLPPGRAMQIFATDIDHEAIEKSRQATFPPSIVQDVSAARLSRFYVREAEGYRLKQEVREMVVFAPQNILMDPPFTKIDILCCRNLLIYINAAAQKKLLPLMHYALNAGGLLILGTAESVGEFGRLFAPLDTKWKVFQRLQTSEKVLLEMPAHVLRGQPAGPIGEKAKEPLMDILYAAQRSLLDLYGPPSVVVSVDGDIVYINGQTGKYLEPSSGKVNINVFAMARQGLREELGVALHDAAKHKTTVTTRDVKVKSEGGWTAINLTVKPLSEREDLRGMFLIVFEEIAAAPAAQAVTAEKPPQAGPPRAAGEVEEELYRTRDRLQTTIEEMQATQEELRSANEELQSNNEELQSTNEEMTSSKEELQSLNEEMQTVNAELQSKIEELSQSNSDMKNLLNGTQIATIFLDDELCVKRFTAQASQVISLIPSDVGRPISHFSTKLKYDGLVRDAKEVLETLVPKELQVQASDGRCYTTRVLPYRTADNVIDGVVMTFLDTTALKQTEVELQEARNFAESIIATIREPLVVLDDELRIVAASRSFYRVFQVEPAETEGRLLYEIGQRQWDIPALKQLLEEILPKNTHFDNFRVEHDFPVVGHKAFLLNARRIVAEEPRRSLLLLAMEETTQASENVGWKG